MGEGLPERLPQVRIEDAVQDIIEQKFDGEQKYKRAKGGEAYDVKGKLLYVHKVQDENGIEKVAIFRALDQVPEDVELVGKDPEEIKAAIRKILP